MFRRGLSDAEIADLINHSDTLDNVESDSDDSECNGVFEEDEIDDSLSSDEDENDVEGVASNPAAVPYPKDSEWTAVDTYRPLPVNTTPRQILVDIDESSSVLDCSKVFLTDSDVNELKRQTNLYASQTIQKKRRGNNLKPHSVLSSWKPVTISEMRRFLGIIFHMCVSKKPKIADHWSTNPVLSCNFCPHVMSRLRFTQILSCLHLVDNSNQKKPGEDGFHPLYKVLPYYNNLKERLYAVAEASSGYVVNFEVYAGKRIVDNSSSAVILRLLSDSSLLNKGHTVYLDRFYSSPELFQQLAEKGTGAVGTVNKSRKGLPKDLVSAKLKKGEMSFRRKDNVLAMKWKDKRDVYTLSTRHQATFGTHTKRNGSVVLKPLQVLDYNLNKIGVDIGDQRLQYNPFQHRTVKWWRKLYFHLLLMGVSNAFWLYNAVHRKKITITDFITVLAVQLVEDDTLEFIPRNEGTVGRLTKRHFLQHIPATTKKYAAQLQKQVSFSQLAQTIAILQESPIEFVMFISKEPPQRLQHKHFFINSVKTGKSTKTYCSLEASSVISLAQFDNFFFDALVGVSPSHISAVQTSELSPASTGAEAESLEQTLFVNLLPRNFRFLNNDALLGIVETTHSPLKVKTRQITNSK
ncbi:piggyBac transposable element-derived protein 4-like [Schistocerca nitens]|uniref:piggyBac transposable element-derived protein 4-like n=1 Tax=Schistocerca nitens TaxID=7011 RepID=UPI00211763E7|nr:piggyBac transposable element-derived protein 4-like [Schistocerca nitens]